MPKRRRSETDTFDYDTVNTSARVYGNQRAQADGLIEIGKKTLFKALKTARGFERQKLGRRQKSARAANNQEDIERLAAEVAALKVRHAHYNRFGLQLIVHTEFRPCRNYRASPLQVSTEDEINCFLVGLASVCCSGNERQQQCSQCST